MCKLVLNKGDTVRNIRKGSSRKGLVGVVSRVTFTHYHIEYTNGLEQHYLRDMAHVSLEKLVSECPCKQHVLRLDLSGVTEQQIEVLKRSSDSGFFTFKEETKRRVLKKVRRNVITGKTQEDAVSERGPSRGVTDFNTRCLGRSTGQALYVIGSAMMYPGNEICISGVDHACSPHTRKAVDQHFRKMVQSMIGNMKGFTFNDTHIVFNPIVTEETYVEL